MNDDDIKQLIAACGLNPSDSTLLYLCREIERTTRQEYFRIIQHANNAAGDREVTPRELDKAIWDIGQKRKAT